MKNLSKDQIEMIVTELNPVDSTELFDSVLDDGQEVIEIRGIKLLPSEVLKNCDPIAYNEELANFLDGFGGLIEINGEYYNAQDVEELLEAVEE